MRIICAILLLFYCFPIFSQDDCKIKIEILDSLLVKNKRQQALKVNVSMELCQCDDTLFIYRFNKVVHTSNFVIAYLDFNLFKNSSVGLNFIIEDVEDNKIQANNIDHISFKKHEDEIRSSYQRLFINKSNLKIKYKLLKDEKKRNKHDEGKYTVSENNRNFILYPLINHYYNLPKGEYYLYFVYSFNRDLVNKPPPSSIWDSEKPDKNRVFNGSFISNKVKLIIK